MLNEKLTQAKVALMLHKPYFGMLASHMDITLNENQESFLCNGSRLEINDDYLASLTLEETQFVLSNAAMHRLLDHDTRAQNKQSWLWQLATDYAINGMLIENGLQAPSRISYSPRFDGMYAEEIYTILKDEIKNHAFDKEDSTLESGYNEQNERYETPKSEGKQEARSQIEAQQQHIQAQHQEALEKATAAHLAPQSIERLVSKQAQPKLNWRDVLSGFVQLHLADDFALFPPNKRHIHRGVYLPSVSHSSKKLAVVVDTSASISPMLLDLFVAELEALRLEVERVDIELFGVDSAVHTYRTFMYGEPLEASFLGGGGSDFRPAFEWIEAEALEIAALIYFTDGAGIFPVHEPDYPVLWILSAPVAIPFGEAVVLE